MCEADDDVIFVQALDALLKAGFDINRGNDDDESFLQRLCLCSRVSESRVRALIRTRQKINKDQVSQLTAKAAISKQRSNPVTKKSI